MNENWGSSNLFAFYGSMSTIAVVYIIFLLPETRGRTLQEIEQYFRTGRMSMAQEKLGEEMVEMVSKPKEALSA